MKYGCNVSYKQHTGISSLYFELPLYILLFPPQKTKTLLVFLKHRKKSTQTKPLPFQKAMVEEKDSQNPTSESEASVTMKGDETLAPNAGASNDATIESNAQGGTESTCNNNVNNGAETSALSSSDEKSLEFSDDLMDRGSKALKDNDFDEAAECFSRALEIRFRFFFSTSFFLCLVAEKFSRKIEF